MEENNNLIRVCNIFIHPSHYRENIYKKLDATFLCRFVFSNEQLKIKTFDTSVLKYVDTCKIHTIGKIQFQCGLLKYVFQNFNYYLVNANINNISSWMFFIFLKCIPRKKTYLWVHGLYGSETRRQIFIRKLYYRLVDGLFLYGEYGKKILIENGINENKLFVLHNSLNYEEQLELRNTVTKTQVYKERFGNTNPVIVMIGRLNKRKKMDYLLESLSSLKSKGLLYNLVVIGDGEYRKTLENRITDYNLNDQVWMYGACYDELVNAQLIYNADLCVVPGDVGLTAIHSMMFGVPVITHNYYPSQGPEFEAIRNGVTGAFYEYNDVSSLTNCIQCWFEANSNKRDMVRKACFEIIDKEWTPNYQLEEFKKVFTNKLINEK